MTAHESPRTTKLYDRTRDQVSFRGSLHRSWSNVSLRVGRGRCAPPGRAHAFGNSSGRYR
jgi:hypothetical protein